MNTKHLAMLVMTCATVALMSCTKTAIDPRIEAFTKLPDWKGVWIAENHEAGINGFNREGFKSYKLFDPAGPWTDEGRARLTASYAAIAKRKAVGWGFPSMMDSAAPLQFALTPNEVLIINSYHEVRYVYTDGRPHADEADRWPTTWGDSVGHWEGDTLVIDTVSVRNPNAFMLVAPPLTDQAHYSERLRKTATDRIEMEITIDDPVTLTKPWVVKEAYIRTPNLDRLVFDAFTNDRSEIDGDAFTITPPKQ
jgi:hypothetical protein